MRPDTDSYFMAIAQATKARSTCARRSVGCILVDEHKHILATGYNGVPQGFPHCTDDPCEGAAYKPGKSLEFCRAIHAEINALIQCADVNRISTVYCTTSPCRQCILALLNTSAMRIVFAEEYPHLDSKTLWESAGRQWVQYDSEKQNR